MNDLPNVASRYSERKEVSQKSEAARLAAIAMRHETPPEISKSGT